MFGSDVLDVSIGIVLLFLFVSLICSALREAAEAALKSRASDLERGIREMLQDHDGTGLAKALYDHPLIYALYAGAYEPGKLAAATFLPGAAGRLVMPIQARGNLPTYIPSETFAAALIDLIRSAAQPDGPLSPESWQDSAAKIGTPDFQRAVTAILAEAGADAVRLHRSVAAWYDAAMDRVSGWYKRRTQFILLGIGLATAAVFNIDALNVARHLSTDKSYRQAVVAVAAGIRQDPAAGQPAGGTTLAQSIQSIDAARTELASAGFLMGWPAALVASCDTKVPCFWAWPQMVLGWIVTALGVSLGAPFWFDLLNKFMVIRSTVKPAEKSGREKSKDA